MEGNFIKPTFKRESLRPIACTKPWFGLDLVDLTNPLSLKIPTGRWQISWLYTKCDQKVELRATENKTSGQLGGGLELGTTRFQVQCPEHLAALPAFYLGIIFTCYTLLLLHGWLLNNLWRTLVLFSFYLQLFLGDFLLWCIPHYFFFWHSFVLLQIDYPPFEKNFYIEHTEIAKLTNQDVQDLRRKLGMKVGY